MASGHDAFTGFSITAKHHTVRFRVVVPVAVFEKEYGGKRHSFTMQAKLPGLNESAFLLSYCFAGFDCVVSLNCFGSDNVVASKIHHFILFHNLSPLLEVFILRLL